MKKLVNRTVWTYVLSVLAVGAVMTSCKDEADPVAPTTMSNQIQYDEGDLLDIKSAIYEITDTDLYTFYLSPSSGITTVSGMTSAGNSVKVQVRAPKGAVTVASDEYAIEYETVSVSSTAATTAKTVSLSANMSDYKTLSLSADVVMKNGESLFVRYEGTCTETVFTLDNAFRYGTDEYSVKSVVFEKNGSTYTYYLSPTEGITDVAGMTAAGDFFKLLDNDGTFEVSYDNLTISDKNAQLLDASASVTTSDDGRSIDLHVRAISTGDKRLYADLSGFGSTKELAELNNQVEQDEEIITEIGSVCLWYDDVEGVNYLLFFTESGVTDPNDENVTPFLSIEYSASAPMPIDLSTAIKDETAYFVLGDDDDENAMALDEETEGTLSVTVSGTTVTFSMDAKKGMKRLRGEYSGKATLGYVSSDTFMVNDNGTVVEADFTKLFMTLSGSIYEFAFGDNMDASLPADLMTGKYAVYASLMSGYGTKLDVSTSPFASFGLYDYAEYTTSTADGATGEFVTHADPNGGDNVYLYVDMTLASGETIEAQYYGPVTSETITDLTPEKPVEPKITITNEDGTSSLVDWDITEMQVAHVSSYQNSMSGEKYSAYLFYFVNANTASNGIEQSSATPLFVIEDTNLGVENKDLKTAGTSFRWNLFFKRSELSQNSGYGANVTYSWGGSAYCCPEDAKLTITKDGKEWYFKLVMKDYGAFASYASSEPTTMKGTSNILTIEWKGAATKYSGSKYTNTMSDDDY